MGRRWRVVVVGADKEGSYNLPNRNKESHSFFFYPIPYSREWTPLFLILLFSILWSIFFWKNKYTNSLQHKGIYVDKTELLYMIFSLWYTNYKVNEDRIFEYNGMNLLECCIIWIFLSSLQLCKLKQTRFQYFTFYYT